MHCAMKEKHIFIKLLFPLFIFFVSFLGCEKDNSNTSIVHSNSQSNNNNDTGNTSECGLVGVWDVSALYYPPGYYYDYPYCEFFCGNTNNEEYWDCSNKYADFNDDDYCWILTFLNDGTMNMLVWDLSINEYDGGMYGTWDTDCKVINIENTGDPYEDGGSGFLSYWEIIDLNSNYLTLKNTDDIIMVAYKHS